MISHIARAVYFKYGGAAYRYISKGAIGLFTQLHKVLHTIIKCGAT